MTNVILRVRDMHLDYKGVKALHGVDLDVAEGELVALVGANGAGKSSLLAGISGLHRPIRGSVEFMGTDISRLPAHKVSALGAILVPEGRRLFGHQTVLQNLLLGAYNRTSAEAAATLKHVYELFPILAERTAQRANTFSGGEQQMIALGRALMSRPKLLMLDEPSLGLSPKYSAMVFQAIARLRDEGVTMLLVEQRLHDALKLADRAYVLQTGRVTISGLAADLAEDDNVRRAYMGL